MGVESEKMEDSGLYLFKAIRCPNAETSSAFRQLSQQRSDVSRNDSVSTIVFRAVERAVSFLQKSFRCGQRIVRQ